ncbi:MAG: pilus assembly protein PilY, partial [Nitrospirae bacterium]|nr:pilus assembly protein PilY [Nitrospirota bacterium]
INSTPRIQSWIPLNDYYDRYNDSTYHRYVNDLKADNTSKTTKLYTDRGMVYVGANDGMLHAIYLGKLEMINDIDHPEKKAQLTDPDTSDGISPGDEVWAFIPKNALPYLKYLKQTDYCHLYYVDASPYIFDASIGTTGCSEANYWDCTKTTDTWRTILIGSMRLGGACRDVSSSCTDCVKTPTSNVGYSSYFALDITDQNNPKLLWEFSSSDLGFSSTGPVVVRISPKTTGGSPDNTKNGRWFVVLASGPTGPIDTTTHEFKGKSDQNLKIFILDLKTGTLLRTIDTGIQYAFGGSQFNTTIDLDKDYQDDVMYLTYVKKVGSGSNASWTGGGIIRLATSGLNSKTSPSIDPDDWKWSKFIELSEGPVTSSVVYARDKKQHILWLFFGSGRYFYKTDDADGRRRIYGIKEPCYSSLTDNINPTCTTTVSESDLTDATTSPPTITQANSASFKGWYVKLDCSATDTNSACANNAPSGYSAERVITTPLASPAGAIFFTTFSPTSDVCGYGGNSYIWAVDYRTGGQAPGTALEGKALLQLSTGEIKEVNLKTAFSERSGRRTVSFSGVPPQGQGLSVMVPPDPIRKFLFMKEK